ncbi:MAG: hypothetical protein LBT37_03355 [Lactobacillaceae bacterium]|jgi:hypothetical protein|nr:hypothetical protein [Lactobacillaceae bacterium]
MTSLQNLVVAVAVIAFVLYRQIRKSEVQDKMKSMLIIGVIGLVEIIPGIQNVNGILFIVGMVVLAAVMALIRAQSYQVFQENGIWYRQGHAMSVILWIVAIGLHIIYDQVVTGLQIPGMEKLSGTSIVLYIAVSLGVQRFFLLRRVNMLK